MGFEFEHTGNETETGDGMEMFEGETKQVCVVLVEPEENDVFVRVSVSLSDDSPSGK